MMLRLTAVFFICGALLWGEPKYERRLQAATKVFSQVMATPEQTIPQDLLNKAECVVIVPHAKKGAFIFGGKYGRGYMSCRRKNGIGWSAPGAIRMEGFNFGLQAGGSDTDIVLLVMNRRGARRLMKSKFTIGGDAAAAAGPVGRSVTANTDILLSAEILSWSRSRGVFAGVALDGATLRGDLGVNERIYGQPWGNKAIIESALEPPEAGKNLISLLNRYSSRKGRAD